MPQKFFATFIFFKLIICSANGFVALDHGIKVLATSAAAAAAAAATTAATAVATTKSAETTSASTEHGYEQQWQDVPTEPVVTVSGDDGRVATRVATGVAPAVVLALRPVTLKHGKHYVDKHLPKACVSNEFCAPGDYPAKL